MILETSRMSLDDLVLDADVAPDRLDRALDAFLSSASSLSRCVHPSTAFSGVRSSWESVARNSSFNRLAFSASMRAADSRASKAARSISRRSRPRN